MLLLTFITALVLKCFIYNALYSIRKTSSTSFNKGKYAEIVYTTLQITRYSIAQMVEGPFRVRGATRSTHGRIKDDTKLVKVCNDNSRLVFENVFI